MYKYDIKSLWGQTFTCNNFLPPPILCHRKRLLKTAFLLLAFVSSFSFFSYLVFRFNKEIQGWCLSCVSLYLKFSNFLWMNISWLSLVSQRALKQQQQKRALAKFFNCFIWPWQWLLRWMSRRRNNNYPCSSLVNR